MNKDEFYEYEDRAYINPTLSSGEQETFIDNLRNIQSQNNAQIAQQTYNLGTDVPSNLGGLGGGEAYFTSRYQTPQVGEMTATLKSAAQAQALNDVMSNYQAQLKQRYNSAYRKAQQRARAAAARAAAASAAPSAKGNVKTQTTSGDVGIWDAVTVDDNQGFYGLNRITRNPGETDAQWKQRYTQWALRNALAEKLGGGKIHPTFGTENLVGISTAVGGGGGGSW